MGEILNQTFSFLLRGKNGAKVFKHQHPPLLMPEKCVAAALQSENGGTAHCLAVGICQETRGQPAPSLEESIILKRTPLGDHLINDLPTGI